MRMKRQIDDLSKQAATVEFPQKLAFSFDIFRIRLLDTLADNGLGRDWEWDDIEQVFSHTLRDDSGGMICSIGLNFWQHAVLNPRKPLAEEIERLLTQQKTFHELCLTIRRAGIAATNPNP